MKKVIILLVSLFTIAVMSCSVSSPVESSNEIQTKVSADTKSINAYPYRIIINTGAIYKAGTDANVFITLFGASGNTREFLLPAPRSAFERYSSDTFTVTSDTYIGTLQAILIRHDDSGGSSGWFLDNIQICDESTYTYWYISCYKWLAKDVDDHLISRYLSVQ